MIERFLSQQVWVLVGGTRDEIRPKSDVDHAHERQNKSDNKEEDGCNKRRLLRVFGEIRSSSSDHDHQIVRWCQDQNQEQNERG